MFCVRVNIPVLVQWQGHWQLPDLDRFQSLILQLPDGNKSSSDPLSTIAARAARAGPPRPDPCPPLRLHFRELACSVMWQQPPSMQPGRPVNIYRAAERRSPGRSWTSGGGWGPASHEDTLPTGGAGPPGSAYRALGILLILCRTNLSAKRKAAPLQFLGGEMP